MKKGSLINAFGPPGTEDAFVAVAQVGQNSAGGTKSDNKVQGKDFNSCEDSMAATEQGCSPFANISTAAATAAPNAASTSPAQDVHAELALLTSLLGRHLHQQQQAAAAATAAAAAAAPAEQQYSARSAPPAPDAADYEDSGYTESPVSAAAAAAAAATSRGGTSTPPVSAAVAAVGGTPSKQGQRARRKNTDMMQKLQALAEVSEDRLAKQEKRMIKNRESAARSRLRRQQHTEALEEQNAGLRAELAALHSQVGMLQARVNELEWQLQPEAAAAANGGPVSERPAKRACL
ncbi:hypothetical protein OEZ85_011783 [Tetradesmus obliquus]|uniref:BZIP domain-containing protein n=1 Tax=Tetradesmus obliquus TaxID=3088 RepID=A0ABY8TVB7_TETOB|nr:hypothetical protein OEZ85_011783 [Tetradesmus obliquus]